MNRMPTRFFGPIRSLLVLLAAASIAVAVSAQALQDDPPGRVARLSDLDGQVWFYSPDSGDWVGATRNRPLTTGDRLATDAGARAELQVGSTTLRLDADTELEVLALDDDRLSLRLHSGSVAARVRDLANAGEVDLATDAGRFIVRRAGSYRFDHRDHTSHATVYSGQARYEGPNSGLPINAGQRAEFWIDAGGVAQYSLSTPLADAFAAWNGERDRLAANSVSARYVSPEMTGAQELDRYGRWEQSQEYGSLWIPTTVVAGWAPYSHGRWAWVRPWGWTWVDDAPWGFAPFHYGRWVNVRNTWGWTPGVRVVRPVYAPALVAWVGGPQVSVSVNIGGPSVGWFPLAPREVFVPSYRVSPRYAQNINITHVTNITQITNVYNNPQAPRQFENRHRPNAITVVPVAVLTEHKPVAPAAAQLRPAPWVRQLQAEPGRTVALVAPPVLAPVVPARVDAGAVRLPPGATDRPATGRPDSVPRDRDTGDRRNGRQDPGRPASEAPRVPEPMTPVAPMATAAPVVPAAPVALPARPAVAPPAATGPTMRAQPVKRGDDQPDDRRASPRPEAPAAADARRPQRAQPAPALPAPRPVEQPTVVPRSVEAPRQVPAPAAPRPADVQRPAPAQAPAAPQPVQTQRPAPVVAPAAPAPPPPEVKKPDAKKAEPQNDGPDQKRTNPREPREQQR